jgi:hypothetical protein
LNNFYNFKIFIEKFGTKWPINLHLFFLSSLNKDGKDEKGFHGSISEIPLNLRNPRYILWGDEIFGRHALSSRG